METSIILVTVILPLLIGYILGKSRDNNKTLFDKKLEIYSDITYHLSSAKDLRLDLDISVEKFKTLANELNSLQEKNNLKLNTSHLDKDVSEKIKEIDSEISFLNYKDNLIKLFAPARLLGSRAVVKELREYYSLISERHKIKDKQDIDNLSKQISRSTMELEQLMRRDLGYLRLLSRLDIWWHLFKDQN